jgi:tRNA A22 N-methylase
MQPKDERILWGQYFYYIIMHSSATKDENTASVFILHRDTLVQPKDDSFQKKFS